MAVFEDRVETTGLGFSLYCPGGEDDWDALLEQHRQLGGDEVSLDVNADNAFLTSPLSPLAVAEWLEREWPGVDFCRPEVASGCSRMRGTRGILRRATVSNR
ncbi:MAG: hypothetical protein Ct9H300mP1_04180 [Planctomycetaceae bacterium]|nr:MAG: hypothetical protein Ct9H300mP1_04180 [Planctomycetaceae bacterium]